MLNLLLVKDSVIQQKWVCKIVENRIPRTNTDILGRDWEKSKGIGLLVEKDKEHQPVEPLWAQGVLSAPSKEAGVLEQKAGSPKGKLAIQQGLAICPATPEGVIPECQLQNHRQGCGLSASV